VKLYLDRAERRRKDFFKLMDLIGGQGSIANKVAAVYELRRFPEHKEFINPLLRPAADECTWD